MTSLQGNTAPWKCHQAPFPGYRELNAVGITWGTSREVREIGILPGTSLDRQPEDTKKAAALEQQGRGRSSPGRSCFLRAEPGLQVGTLQPRQDVPQGAVTVVRSTVESGPCLRIESSECLTSLQRTPADRRYAGLHLPSPLPLQSLGLSLAGFLNIRQHLKGISEFTEESWGPIFRVLPFLSGLHGLEVVTCLRMTPAEQG